MRRFLIFRNAVAMAVAVFSASCPASEARSALRLSDAMAIAGLNSPELKKLEAAEDSASWGELEALSDHLPHLAVRGVHFLGAKYSKLGVLFGGNPIEFPSAFPQSELDIEASLLIFDGLGAVNRYRASLLEHEASRLELDHLRFQLENAVKIRFYQTLAAQELVKVTDQNLQTLEQHLTLARASRRAGFSTSVDVLRIESQLEEARAEKLLAADNVILARQALLETMGVETDDRSLEGNLPSPESRSIPDTLQLDLGGRSDLQALLRREQAQDRLSSAAAGVWFPRVSVFGVEQFYKFGEFDPAILPNSSFQNAYSYGLRLSWNLFDGGASIAKRARTRDSAIIAGEVSRTAQIVSPHEFDAWKRKYIYNTALFGARKRAVEKSAESVRLATLGVQAGTKTHSETLDAELELFRARAGVIRAQVDASEAWSNLELAVGHRIAVTKESP